MDTKVFQDMILAWHKQNSRHNLPWRKTKNPYRILVSEVMLQQTQVSRVEGKYKEFLKAFPTQKKLAEAGTKEVLTYWQGLGYNRRVLNLQKAVHGPIPKSIEGLEALPGIGPYTARAIMVFAHNKPEVLLETNIRRVYLHFFFPHKKNVTDKELERVIESTMDKKDPRTWYWALMDYGAMAMAKIPNPNRRSRHYQKQSRFEGSRRQVRAGIVKVLLASNGMSKRAIKARVKTKHDVEGILEDLKKEGFLQFKNNRYTVNNDRIQQKLYKGEDSASFAT
ncbi:MAG: A/G-specific adenine glycosylase [bacterium]|nr:A/G-specific adenine glycosylase [bacterium]